MRTCPFPLTLTREQARRLQGYVQTYRRYALAALLPCTDRNALLRVLQGMQGRLLEAMDQPVPLVQLPLSQEEMTSLRVMSNELLRLYAQEPASEQRSALLTDVAAFKISLKSYEKSEET